MSQWPHHYPNQPQRPPRKRGGLPVWLIVLLCVGGGALALSCVTCGVFAWWLNRSPEVSAAARRPFDYADVPTPRFPARGAPRQYESTINRHVIRLGDRRDGYYAVPGHGGQMWLFLPNGNHPPRSLPCILFAPAGATAFSGMLLGEGDVPEILPYVREGFAVLAYEIDGPYHGGEFGSDEELKRAFDKFSAARAGLVNARNALEYVLSQVPEVDPERVYSAGHSSAADMSLLFAAHESRLAGCLAYMPSYDKVEWLTPLGIRMAEPAIPGAGEFVVRSSPSTHIENIQCPVFLYHAEDDSNVDVEIVREGAAAMKQAGVNVTFQTAEHGDHYDAMIQQGIPAAISWLKQLDRNP